MRALTQFRILFWKNWLLQKRKVWLTVFEIGLPTVFALVLVFIRQLVDVTEYAEPRTWPAFGVQQWPLPPPIPGTSFLRWQVAYTPKNPMTEELMSHVRDRLKLSPGDLSFNTEEEMVAYLTDDALPPNIWGGIVFSSLLDAPSSLPKKMEYRIRPTSKQRFRTDGESSNSYLASDWYTEIMFPGVQIPGPRVPEDPTGGLPYYQREAFLALQHAIDIAIISQVNSSAEVDDIDVSLRRFPYPSYVDDGFIFVIQVQFPFIILLSFIITAPNITKDIVLEKERKLKEFMKMMGLSSWLHWLAWFLKYFIFMLISVVIMTVLFCVKIGPGAILNQSDPTVLFVFLMLYACSTICFCFAVSAFFKKANSGAAAGGILFFLTYIPYTFMQMRYSDLNYATKISGSFLNNVAMSLGCVQFALYEGTGAGIQWSNFAKPVTVDENFTLAHVFLMLILDCMIYLLIVWYFDNVMPGDYGISRPWYFPFTKTYWCGKSASVVDLEARMGDCAAGEFFESSPTDIKAGISIRSLRKEFKTGKTSLVAVSGTNMDMYENQITALLGHNGAGKTTTMSMLTGFMSPTSGTAYINGFDIRTDLEEARRVIGLCPQHNVLYDTLTVKEHLIFYAQLKGCSGDKVNSEVVDMIQTLGLEDKTDARSATLSGGMKRKLSVGIALIGGSKIVMLDEPTSGMDPQARRQTWDILQSQRQGRTMVLSTHFMDEADLLGDRIAIMAEGTVQCAGTSLFLKNKYGVGYHMVMVKEPSCDVQAVTEVITKYVPQAALESNISAELSYILPNESVSQFEELFNYMEGNKALLGIASFGASVTTMEEVFLKVGESVEGMKDAIAEGQRQDPDENRRLQDLPREEDSNGASSSGAVKATATEITPLLADRMNNGGVERAVNPVLRRTLSMEEKWHLKPVLGMELVKNTGIELAGQQFYGMFYKRMLHTWRSRLVTVSQLIIPIFFTAIAGIVLQTLPEPSEPPALDLAITQFTEQTIAYATNATDNDHIAALITSLQTSLQGKVDGFVYVNDIPAYKEDPSLIQFIGDIGSNDMDAYNRRYMAAATFEGNGTDTNFTMYFNNQAYHTIAISLHVLGNTLMQYFHGKEYSISTTNHPLPRSDADSAEAEVENATMLSFIFSTNVLFGMSFLIASFVIFLIKERTIKSKHIQFVSGVHVFNFWLSTFAWDFINFFVASVPLLAVFAIFDVQPYIDDLNALVLLLLIVLFGWSVLPFTYLLSYLFQVPASGYVWTTVFNLFTGIFAVLAIYILQIPQLGTEDVADALQWAFFIVLPNFCFGFGLQDMYSNYENKRICDTSIWNASCPILEALNVTSPCCPGCADGGGYCATFTDSYLAWEKPGIGRQLTFLLLQGFVWFALIFLFESGFFQYLLQMAVESTTYTATVDVETDPLSMSAVVEEDSDVRAEKQRIATTPISRLQQTDSIVLSQMRKYYGGFLAVDSLSVGIPQGECFGLLGVNGAGKTTTFKMLTGDIALSSGDAFLDGFSVKKDVGEVQKRLGYCPQFDALIERMTVRETLVMYARLRGVVETQIQQVVEKLVTALLLSDHIDKEAGDLSGGNKRKLSTAIALVGDPPVVFLDEPTTGMDPVARRRLWDTLSKVRASGRTLILTSHSMEECEALCTRLAIMVNGQFKCLGSTQHLKTRFGQGYTLLAKMAGMDSSEIEANTHSAMTFIQDTFPGCQLKDLHQGYLHYQIPSEGVTWGRIFGTLERAKEQYHIEDYSVSQTSLEQVFINFARAQIPPKEDAPGCGVKTKSCCKFFCCCGCCATQRRIDEAYDTHL